MDDLPSRSRTFQNSARGIPQDRSRMGDSWRFGTEVVSSRRGEGGVPTVFRYAAVFCKAVVEVDADVCGGGRYSEDDADCD